MVNQKPVNKKSAVRRRKAKVSMQLTAVLIVIALVIGAVIGFFIGRNTIAAQPEEALAVSQLDSWENSNAEALDMLSGDAWDSGAEWDGNAWADGGEAFFGNDTAPIGFDESGEDVIVAEFSGGEIMRSEAVAGYNEMAANYIFSGYTEDQIPESLLTDLLRDMAQQEILKAKAQEMGVYELTEADRVEISAQAENTLNEMIPLFRGFIDSAGKDESTVIEETKAYLAEHEGISYDSVYAMISEGWWSEKLYDAVVKDVSVENADITALYNEKMADQKATFSEYPDVFESTQMRGEAIVYNLEGYRAVRLLSVSSDESGAAETATLIEDQLAMTEDETLAAQYRAELDALYAPAERAMEEITAQIENGAVFADMLAQYGEDIGMQAEYLNKTGYYVSENSMVWPKQMTDAAFALKNPGDISEPFRMNGSVCIIEYVGEVIPGELAIDAVYDMLSAEALESRRALTYASQIDQWMTEADIKYYPERMK